MDKKYLKLAVLGIVVFAILLALFVFVFNWGGRPSAEPPPDPNPHIVLKPYFVSQFLKENPDYKPSQPLVLSFDKVSMIEVPLSEQGFSLTEIAIGESTGLVLSNKSSKTFSFAITSPAIDGTNYSAVQFVVAPAKTTVLDLVILPYFGDIVEKSGAKAEKKEKGVLVFEVACISGCADGGNLLKVYANAT
ncbi:MAG: hypothetical protein QXK06_00360 [Candidatus Diapherotrites archaeon]